VPLFDGNAGVIPGLSRNCDRGANLRSATAGIGWKAEVSGEPGARTPSAGEATRMEER
jgi:hypothetical protein